MLPFLLLLLSCVTGALCGSLCPNREDIYPCNCINLAKGIRLNSTIVNCHRLEDSNSLQNIFKRLSEINIDRFNLYDSFWNENDKKNLRFPENWLPELKSTDIEIVDTHLSPSFACQVKRICQNTYIKRFSITNSSFSGDMITRCTYMGRANSYNWINCMVNLEELEIKNGKLNMLQESFLLGEMNKLKRLYLSHNHISTIHYSVFSKVPGLKILDASHNHLTALDNIFKNKIDLEILDMSYNKIKTLDQSLLSPLHKLKNFYLKGNEIISLEEMHWNPIPLTLRIVDLTDNPLHCHCNVKWLKDALNKRLSFIGRCHTPKKYNGRYLIQTVGYLSKACDDNGNIQKLTTKKY